MTNTARATHERLSSILRVVGLAVIGGTLIVSLLVIKPAYPKRLQLLAGREGSGYHAMGTRLAAELTRRGLETQVIITDGGIDNLRRLAAGAENTLGFVPSNLEHAVRPSVDTEHVVSLGSIGYEPLWFFFRSELEVGEIRDLAVLTVATGGAGSVGDWVARRLLEINGIELDLHVVEAPGSTDDVVAALRAEPLDGIFALGAPSTPTIRRLLVADGISFMGFDRADAYVAVSPGLVKLIAPAGVFDLARNVPPRDTPLVAATTNLATVDSLHPAVVPVVLRAVAASADLGDVFTRRGTFPSPEGASLPLDPAAERIYDQGESVFSREIPYGLARQLDHIGFVVMPLLGIALALVKVLPTILGAWTTIRFSRLYRRLEAVEKAAAAGADPSGLLADLQAIDTASADIFVPRSAVADYMDLRQLLHDLRDRTTTPEAKARTPKA